MRSEAYQAGYEAGWEFHMGSGRKDGNPYPDESQDYIDWEDGFTEAGCDS